MKWIIIDLIFGLTMYVLGYWAATKTQKKKEKS